MPETTPTATLFRKALSPSARAIESFLASDQGERLLRGEVTGATLRDRIVLAFSAGVEAGYAISSAAATEIVRRVVR